MEEKIKAFANEATALCEKFKMEPSILTLDFITCDGHLMVRVRAQVLKDLDSVSVKEPEETPAAK